MERHLKMTRVHEHALRDLCQTCLAQLIDAAALYGGDFLEGFSLGDSPAFDEWQFFQPEHLRQEIAATMQRLTLYHSAHNDLEAALTVARRWAALDPRNEPAHRCLMEHYTIDGQRAVALHQYDVLLHRLKAARLEPASETIHLYLQIRAGKVQERPSQMTPPATIRPPAMPMASCGRVLPCKANS